MPDLTNASCPCRGCAATASNKTQVKNLFGLRNMGNGTIRVQSYCRKCRILHCKANAPKCN